MFAQRRTVARGAGRGTSSDLLLRRWLSVGAARGTHAERSTERGEATTRERGEDLVWGEEELTSSSTTRLARLGEVRICRRARGEKRQISPATATAGLLRRGTAGSSC